MKKLTTKDVLLELSTGETLQNLDDETSFIEMKNDTVTDQNGVPVKDFLNHSWTLYTKPELTVSLTKNQIIAVWSEHVLGYGAGNPLKDDRCVNFLRALGFSV